MLKIIFFNFLGVLNFIICMFSGTVDEFSTGKHFDPFPTNKN